MNILKEINKLKGWKDLSQTSKKELIKNSTYNHYGKEAILYNENTSQPTIYLILSGYVILSKISNEGKEKYLYYLSGGDLANQCVLDGQLTTTRAKTLQNTKIISINKNIFLNLMEKDFKLSLLVMSKLTASLSQSQREILELGTYNVSQRTISKLLSLSRNYGRIEEDYILIDIPINQTDLSRLVGASRESVNRALKELEDENLIFFIGHKIAIANRKKLLEKML